MATIAAALLTLALTGSSVLNCRHLYPCEELQGSNGEDDPLTQERLLVNLYAVCTLRVPLFTL